MAKGLKSPTLSHRLEAMVLKSVTCLLRLIGVDAASALMGRLWRIFAPFNRRHGRADLHLRMAMPALTAAERRALLGDMWDNLGRTAAEALLIDRVIADASRFEITEGTRQAVAALDGGAVLVSLHQGNWEFAAWGGRLLGQRVAGVYKRLRNPLSEAYLHKIRQPIYDAGLHEAGGLSALRMRTLTREGACVAIMGDLPDRTGLCLPFMGYPAYLSSYPVTLGRRLGVPVIVGHVIRLGGVRFRIDARRIEMPQTDDIAADIETGTRLLHGVLADWIAETPSQWMWAIKKWPKDVVRRWQTSVGE